MRARLRRWWRVEVGGFRVGDLLLAAVFLLIAIASVLAGQPDEGALAVTLPAAVLMAGSLAWLTTRPIISVILVIAGSAFQSLLATSPGSLWSLVIMILVMYALASHYREGTAAIAGVCLVAALLIEERIDNGPDYVFIVVLFGGTWLLGRASRMWRGRVSRAEREQTALAQLAVADERLRIARELHDTVAHSLTVVAVQAGAADAALEHDPQLAREPLRTIARTAQQSLAEIRDVLRQLRDPDDDRPLEEPDVAPGLSGIDDLLRSARFAGIRVDAEVDTAGPLPRPVDSAAYRIVQEALTNVARHAPGARASVRIERRAGDLVVEVDNDRGDDGSGTPGTGLGLLGIRERVYALGGTFLAGPAADGFRVCVELPIARAPE
jgi:signal transduction histidine kinase